MSANKFDLSKVKPTAGYVFIEPEDQPSQTSGGIYLPDNVKGDKPQAGTVLVVGPDEENKDFVRKSPAKKGDKVLYKKWGGNEVKIDNKEYLLVKFEDILAVIS